MSDTKKDTIKLELTKAEFKKLLQLVSVGHFVINGIYLLDNLDKPAKKVYQKLLKLGHESGIKDVELCEKEYVESESFLNKEFLPVIEEYEEFVIEEWLVMRLFLFEYEKKHKKINKDSMIVDLIDEEPKLYEKCVKKIEEKGQGAIKGFVV